MPEPVFSGNDRVDTVGLPAELVKQLEGKTAAEQTKLIIQFYQQRENTIITNAREAIATAKAGAVQPTPTVQPTHVVATLPTKEEFWNDPVKAVQAIQSGVVSKEEFNRATASAQRTIIQMAEKLASDGKEHWNRFLPDIRAIMNTMPPDQQADANCWIVAYNNVVGQNWATLKTETIKTATATEIVQAPVETNEPPIDLNKITFPGAGKTAANVADGFGITHDKYREADKRIKSGVFPGLTLDNRGAR